MSEERICRTCGKPILPNENAWHMKGDFSGPEAEWFMHNVCPSYFSMAEIADAVFGKITGASQ